MLLAVAGFALLSVGDAIVKTMAGQWSPLAVGVATALGYLVFGDVPDLLTLVGASIIIGAGLFLWWRTPRPPPALSDSR